MRIFPGNLPPAGASSMPSNEDGQDEASEEADDQQAMGLGQPTRAAESFDPAWASPTDDGNVAEVVEGAVVREIEVPQIVDAEEAPAAAEKPSRRRPRAAKGAKPAGESRSRKAGDGRGQGAETGGKASCRAEPQPLRSVLARVVVIRAAPRSCGAVALSFLLLVQQVSPRSPARDRKESRCPAASSSFGSDRLWTLTPSRRTGRVPASVRSRSAQARAASASGIAGWRRLALAARDRREVRVPDLDRHRAADERLALQPRRVVARHLVDGGADLIAVGQVRV